MKSGEVPGDEVEHGHGDQQPGRRAAHPPRPIDRYRGSCQTQDLSARAHSAGTASASGPLPGTR
jgi:hypothetical protein